MNFFGFGIGWEINALDFAKHGLIYFLVVWLGSPVFTWLIKTMIKVYNWASEIMEKLFGTPVKRADGFSINSFSNMRYIKISTAGLMVAVLGGS